MVMATVGVIMAAMIVLMLAVIWLIQRVVGARKLGRRQGTTDPAAIDPGMAQLGGTAA